MKMIVSSVQESKFVANLQEEKKSGKKVNRGLLMLLGFQLSLSALVSILLILGWSLKQDTGVPSAQQSLGEEEVKNRKSVEQKSGDLTEEEIIWKFRSDIAQLDSITR